MHIPIFPPTKKDWTPSPLPYPPVPNFFFNPRPLPWLSPEDRERITREAGHYATARAESMVPQAAGPEAVRRAALRMWQNLATTMGVPTAEGPAAGPPLPPLPRAPTAEGRPRGRPRKIAGPLIEPAPVLVGPPMVSRHVVSRLAPEVRQQLITSIREYKQTVKGTPSETKSITEEVKTWAGELRARLTDEEANQLIAAAT